MSTLYAVLGVGYIIFCALFITVIMMQKKRSANSGHSAGSNTYWQQNKGRSSESKLLTLTKLMGAIFFIYTLLMSAIV